MLIHHNCGDKLWVESGSESRFFNALVPSSDTADPLSTARDGGFFHSAGVLLRSRRTRDILSGTLGEPGARWRASGDMAARRELSRAWGSGLGFSFESLPRKRPHCTPERVTPDSSSLRGCFFDCDAPLAPITSHWRSFARHVERLCPWRRRLSRRISIVRFMPLVRTSIIP